MKIPSIHLFALTVLLTTGIFVGSALSPRAATAATTYYVATTGLDTNTCAQARSTSTPKRTINKALGCLIAGDTLSIRAGTYPEIINSNFVTIPIGTSWSSPVTIAAYPGEQVVLKPPSADAAIGLAHPYVQYVIFDGLIVDAVNVQKAISLTNGAHHVRFKNMELKNGLLNCVATTPGTGVNVLTYNEFTNNRCHDTYHPAAVSGSHGFYIGTGGNLFEHNTIYNTGKYGITIYYGGTAQHRVNNNIVRANEIYNVDLCHNQCPGSSGGSGIGVSAGSGTQVYNNIIRNTAGGSGIEVAWRNPSNAKIYNNTVYDAAGGIFINSDSTNAVVENNIVSLGGGVRNSGSGTTLSNNLTTDPKFVNPSASDFHLQVGSPAINAGMTLSAVTTDFDAVSRPQGASYDIGAYEYQTSSTSTNSPLASPTNLQFSTQ
jgi:hypothetical protein